MSVVSFKAAPGNAATWNKLATVSQGYRQGIRRGWFQLGKDLKKEANREILHGKKTGHIYKAVGKKIAPRRARRRFRHQASAPFETHANLSGDLRRSIGWKVEGFSTRKFGYGVSGRPTPEYAPFVEFGTFGEASRSGAQAARMFPRPSLENAIKARERKGIPSFVRYVGREIK